MNLKEYLKHEKRSIPWIAAELGVSSAAVYQWFRFNGQVVPIKYWKILIKMSREKITAQDLLEAYYK